MKYDVKLRYLARAFVDAETIAPTADDISELVSGALVGMTAGVIGEQGDDGRIKQRTFFATAARDHLLSLGSLSFDYVGLPTDFNGTNLDWAAFVDQAPALLEATTTYFGRRPHRLALIQEGMLASMPEAEMGALQARLMSNPTEFGRSAPFEWDWRAAFREQIEFGGLTEACNKVVTIERTAGVLSVQPVDRPIAQEKYDRVRVDVDLNTSATETRGRFDADAIKAFFAVAKGKHEEMSATLARQIEGKS